MMDYARLVHARWDRGAGLVPELTVFAPQPFDGMSGKLFGTDGVFARDLAARYRHPASQEVHEMRGGSMPRRWPAPEIHQIHDGFCHSESGWTVLAVSVPHAQPYLDCFAFRIDASGRSIVYSGDSGPSPALTELAEGADILIHMCFQFSGEARSHEWLRGSSGHLEIAECASRAGVATVILTHLQPAIDEPGVRERVCGAMSAICSGRIVIGENLQVYEK